MSHASTQRRRDGSALRFQAAAGARYPLYQRGGHLYAGDSGRSRPALVDCELVGQAVQRVGLYEESPRCSKRWRVSFALLRRVIEFWIASTITVVTGPRSGVRATLADILLDVSVWRTRGDAGLTA